jgi:hypothetical protein
MLLEHTSLSSSMWRPISPWAVIFLVPGTCRYHVIEDPAALQDNQPMMLPAVLYQDIAAIFKIISTFDNPSSLGYKVDKRLYQHSNKILTNLF